MTSASSSDDNDDHRIVGKLIMPIIHLTKTSTVNMYKLLFQSIFFVYMFKYCSPLALFQVRVLHLEESPIERIMYIGYHASHPGRET